MPKFFSSLKPIYKKTYEELNNPKSPIGIFLAQIDDYEYLESAKEIREAVKNYIDVYKKEENNFVEPEDDVERISYRAEQKRLQQNLEVENKLAQAVQKMHDALDVFAEARLKQRENYTTEQIKAMTDRKAQLKAQRERVMNAAYNLEVDLENKMIEKLKAEYKVFEHRPMESKVETPPFVYDSPHYRIRHIELKGDQKVPTALYGLMRFRDLLNDHESMIGEAERSRQYEKFVNDRLAGFQAWKNTLDIEQKLYHEISSSVDSEYFERYNKFMEEYPGTSCVEGYKIWYRETYKEIEKLEEEIKLQEKQQEQLDEEFVQLEESLKNFETESDLEKKSLENQIKTIDEDPVMSQTFFDNNENTRIEAEKLLEELENNLKKKDEEINTLDEEQSAARQTMLENVQWIQNYNNELNQLEEDLKEDAHKALQKFLKNYDEGAKKLDDILHQELEEFRATAQTMDVHNDNIQKTEKAMDEYSKEVARLRKDLDETTETYEAAKKKAEQYLKEQQTIGQRLIRTFNIFGQREESETKLEAAEDQQKKVEDYEGTINKIKADVEKQEKNLAEKQAELDNYKQAWKTIHEDLKKKIQKSYEFTTELQEKLSRLESESQKANTEYKEKVEEIQKDSEESKKTYQTMLDKTSSDFDRMNMQKMTKEIERKKILQEIEEVKEKIGICNKNSETIKNNKAKREELRKSREELDVKTEKRKTEISQQIENARQKCAEGKKQLGEKRASCETMINSHNKLKEFYKKGKVTSNRILEDLSAALAESMVIASEESQKQLDYIKKKENELMESFRLKMSDKNWFAERMQSQEADKDTQKATTRTEKKDTKVEAGVFNYMNQLSSMKRSNSKSFENLRKAVMKQYSENGEFLLNPIDGIKHDENLKEVKENLKQIADSAKAYLKEKGSANRFTQVGKGRYRFADEMRTYAETMLHQFELMEKEKDMADKLMKMDDSELYVSKQISFYKTDSYNMTRKAFVKKGELDKMNMMNLGKELAGEKKKEVLEESVLEESDGMER